MPYIHFTKEELINLDFSLEKEVLDTNEAGCMSLTTIVGCNTRKYHGLLTIPVETIQDEKHVLLSAMDERIVQQNTEFKLSLRKYSGDFIDPHGHQYMRDFMLEQVPKMIFRVGNVVLTKEYLLAEKEEQLLIKYTLEESLTPVDLILRPFLASRSIHTTTRSNLSADGRVRKVANGVRNKMYPDFPHLYMQLSRKNEFTPSPDWYYNLLYTEESKRGYEDQEDLFVPGFFEINMRKGDTIVFSASTKEVAPNTLKRRFEIEKKKKISANSYYNCLMRSAKQFISKKKNKTEITAGYPWFGSWGRDTFIALPGLTLALEDEKTFMEVMQTMVKKMKGGLFPNMEGSDSYSLNSADAPLWFIWAVQQYGTFNNRNNDLWKKFGTVVKKILKAYRDGMDYNIKVQDDGLVYAGQQGYALTWMDAVINGIPVTPRTGFNVEINALWYNAIQFALNQAKEAGDNSFVKEWQDMPGKVQDSFTRYFWDDEKQYLADYGNYEYKDWSVRPNQLFAVSMPYSPLDNEKKAAVLKIVRNELLTPRGIRTLSPKNPDYKGEYKGSQENRDKAYHQGTAWPWLLGHFCDAYLALYKNQELSFVKNLVNDFEKEMTEHGLASVSEIYDGDPPNHAKGTVAQAWSVAELSRIIKIMEQFNHK